MTPSKHLFVVLSPHFDDAVFSCGAAISRWIRNDEDVLVINICAASPGPNEVLSSLAQDFHSNMGGGDIVGNRRKEDARALEILGVDHVDLAFKDCIYRGPEDAWYYQTASDIFSVVHQEESRRYESVKRAIEDAIPRNVAHTLIAPLGIGLHVDHQIVRQTAEAFKGEGIEVLFYEDYPYADPNFPHPIDKDNTSNLEGMLAETPNMKAAFVELAQDDLERKVEAVMCYPSQLALMFGEVEAVPKRVRSFSEEGNRLVERFWKIDSP